MTNEAGKQLAQLTCQKCEIKRQLTEVEIDDSTTVIKNRSLKPDAILNIWSVYDGDTCTEGGYHNYEWDVEFLDSILDKAAKRKKSDGEIAKLQTKCEELAIADEKADAVAQQQVEEIIANRGKDKEKIHANITEHETVIEELEKMKPELEEEILKTSGRDWKGWAV